MLLEQRPDLLQRKLHELEAKREREMPNSFSKLSMGNQALETSQPGPLWEYCAIQDSPPCRFATHLQILLLWESLTEFPPAFRAQLGHKWFVNVLVTQTLELKSMERLGFRYFIWISFFPSSQHSYWEAKPRILIDTARLTRSFRTANIHFTK